MNLSEIHIRDPFVLPVATGRRYYLYGTMGKYAWSESAVGFDCYTSTDLQTWEGPFPVFRPPPDFWANRNFWAPEVYPWHGRYAMFASFKAEGMFRGTQILVAACPSGPFHPLGDRPVTPRNWECLDGSLYVSPDGAPWMVFCHEWVQVSDGEVCALPLDPELTASIGDPVLLFRASEAPWTVQIDWRGGIKRGRVTDGPWLQRLRSGELLMLWSSHSLEGYTIGIARSASGDILGPWKQDPQPLYSRDGGHCMTFTDFEGRLWLSLHHPNGHPDERPIFLQLSEERLAAK
jgi:arabinan endo-1,5-alpha-L-arabinosidase